MYRLSELDNASAEFRKVFQLVEGLKFFLDNLMSVARNQLCIDIVKLDKCLRELHPEDDDLSMIKMVDKHYGPQGNALIDKLI